MKDFCSSDREIITEFARRHHSHAEESEIGISVLQGGLESAVARVDVEGCEAIDCSEGRFVVKRIDRSQKQEISAYELVNRHSPGIAPRLLDLHENDDHCYLFLDWVVSASNWPWVDLEMAHRLAEQLARLHEMDSSSWDDGGWDYETALDTSAQETLHLVEEIRGKDFRSVTGRRASLRRLVADLGRIREFLFNEGPFSPTLIHGDAHPGNAIVHRDGERPEAVLIDWGRTRIGSPFEDLSSWLQSLGLWEPQARQRHDQLLTRYLHVRGIEAINSEVRDHYWLAAGCNSLAGALRFHLKVALQMDEGTAERQYHIGLASRWMAIIRRADQRWRQLK